MYRSPGEQILNGILIALWILCRPFVWIYGFARWFTLAVVKETGNRIVQIVAGIIAVGIVGYISTIFLPLL